MKNVIVISLTLIWLILTGALFAQSYTGTIQNQTVNGTDFSFDIYMQRTDATEIYLGQSEFSVTFNDGNFTSPTVSYVSGPGLAWYTVDVAIPVGFSYTVKFSVGALLFNNQSEYNARVFTPSTTAPGSLIATIKISGITNAFGIAGILWRTIAPHESKVNSYQPSDPWPLTNITSNGTYTDPPDYTLPVELLLFKARVNGDKVELNWETATETNNSGFDVERKLTKGNWLKIGFVEGQGNSSLPKSYKYTDNKPLGGSKFVYRLKQIDYDGSFEYSGQVEAELIPGEYKLYQNYPNPFNPTSKIKFNLPEASNVNISVYNALGEFVINIVDEKKEAGYYEYIFNGSNLSSGIYIYRLTAGNKFTSVKKMILMK